jgi:chromosomal replication initiation ATPase DnaA
MTAASRQLVLDLAHRSALDLEDFLVSGSNAAAVDLIDRWPDWPHWAATVVGPEGSGKTHLAHVWRSRTGAGAVTGSGLTEAAVAELEARGAMVVEDLDRGIASERVLFHMLNVARDRKLSLLLTSRTSSAELAVALPDLASRLKAAPQVHIEAPDEALLKSVLVKLFADRQLVVEPHVVTHIALHMERSMAAANRIVAAADRIALTLQRRVTRAVAAEALASVGDTRS